MKDMTGLAALEGKSMSERQRAAQIVPIGQGEIDYKSIFAQAPAAGMKYFFVEQDSAPQSGDSLAAAATSYAPSRRSSPDPPPDGFRPTARPPSPPYLLAASPFVAVLLAARPLLAALGRADEQGRPSSRRRRPWRAQLPPGYKLELVAAEPLVQDPVAIDFDADGRMGS